MTQAPPVPHDNQSPFPSTEPPQPAPTTPPASVTQAGRDAAPLAGVLDTARDRIAPLQASATNFAKARPFATAALVGTVALALFGSLRGNRTR